MATINVRRLDEDVVNRLKRRAAPNTGRLPFPGSALPAHLLDFVPHTGTIRQRTRFFHAVCRMPTVITSGTQWAWPWRGWRI